MVGCRGYKIGKAIFNSLVSGTDRGEPLIPKINSKFMPPRIMRNRANN